MTLCNISFEIRVLCPAWSKSMYIELEPWERCLQAIDLCCSIWPTSWLWYLMSIVPVTNLLIYSTFQSNARWVIGAKLVFLHKPYGTRLPLALWDLLLGWRWVIGTELDLPAYKLTEKNYSCKYGENLQSTMGPTTSALWFTWILPEPFVQWVIKVMVN